MSWLSAAETQPILESLPYSTDSHWAMSRFLQQAFYCEDFHPSHEWASVVKLSPEGEANRRVILDDVPGAEEYLIRFVLFRRFYQYGLLVDCQQTDAAAVESLLSSNWSSKQTRWPYVFGNELYKKFNETFDGNRTEFLEAKDVNSLLSGTPDGMFQVGKLLSGPLGFLKSEQRRLTPPLLQMPLWHCSDPGCGALHEVEARPFNSQFIEFVRTASRVLSDKFGPPSEWRQVLDRSAKGKAPQSGRMYADMLTVICDCIVGDEARSLCERALRSDAGVGIRQLIGRTRALKGSPSEMVSALQHSECRQLLLLLKDSDIAQFLDELIAEGKIDIPPTEVRKPRTYVYRGYSDHRTELSSLGVRTTFHPPILRLQGEIWQGYRDNNALGDLEWKIRKTRGQGDGLRIALMDYIREVGPEETVHSLIFSSQLICEQIEQRLNFRLTSTDSEEDSARKLLWKFGFSIPRFGRDQELMRNRMADFKSAVLRMPMKPSEEDRATVRGIGANLFVSVEGFLEDLLVFNVWVITADHFLSTHFKYDKGVALKAVGQHLGAVLGSGESKVHWKETGENTLGVLLGYLAAFRNWLEGRREADSGPLKREKVDLPHYANDPLWSFPFQHKELWADVPVQGLSEYLALIENLHQQASQADIPSVRNGLDHKRKDAEFPTADRMIACVSRLEQMFDLADHRNLMPKLIWEISSEQDSFGNSTSYLRDYKGSTTVMLGPPPLPNTRTGGFGVPFIAAPLNFLALPNAHMLFNVSEKSPYSDYWSNYPMRRYIPPRAGQDSNTSTTESEPAVEP